jgi:hypothetical protein
MKNERNTCEYVQERKEYKAMIENEKKVWQVMECGKYIEASRQR